MFLIVFCKRIPPKEWMHDINLKNAYNETIKDLAYRQNCIIVDD